MHSAPKVVLIVDDDPILLATCKTQLEELGYTVLAARNGEHALKQLRGRPVDVVFLDILMPDKDGIETLLEIKKMNPAPAVIAMSGGGRTGLNAFLDVAIKFGASGALKKPFTVADMVKLMPQAGAKEIYAIS